MTIVEFNHTHIPEAAALALANYEEERGYVLTLPQIEAVPALTSFADNGLGVAAFDGGKMVGFLCCCPPFDNAFGTTIAKGVFSPMGANASIKENRAKIYAAMYQMAAVKWVKAGASSHAICLYAHDEETQRQLYRYGFGLRCMDAICDMKEIEDVSSTCPFEMRMVSKSENALLRPLRRMLTAHLGESPCFMRSSQERTEAILPMDEERSTHVFACFKNGLPVAFLEVSDGGETFASELHGVKNICGAFCLPECRGKGVIQSLLNFAMSILKAEGFIRLGVDFESFNPTAYGFWLKYFVPYTHSVVRRIDESAIELYR